MNIHKIIKTGKSLLVALLLAITFRSFLYEPFHIPSGSMKGTLMIGDYIFVSKYSYGFSRYSFPFGIPVLGKEDRKFYTEPKRGDIIVFRKPNDTGTNYVKRLIGLPGDKVQLKHGALYINDKPVPREKIKDFTETDYLGNTTKTAQYVETLENGLKYKTLDQVPDSITDNTQVYSVPKDHFFVLGDNRDNSFDSRFLNDVGFIPKNNLVGKAQLVVFSVSRNKGIIPFKFDINRFFKKIR
ncbi:MAG: signal peptidase I [Rickettsiaceae bacterium H1]|nr:signal peptidase I [Rickettsiaceae bacterium H1]